jgi:hypothetical protein
MGSITLPPLMAEPETPEEERIIKGDTVFAYVVGAIVFLIVVPLGALNVLAALGWWNPLRIEGRLWSGVLMIAAPLLSLGVTSLPIRYKEKIPESAGCLLMLLVWVALGLAFCGGR